MFYKIAQCLRFKRRGAHAKCTGNKWCLALALVEFVLERGVARAHPFWAIHPHRVAAHTAGVRSVCACARGFDVSAMGMCASLLRIF